MPRQTTTVISHSNAAAAGDKTVPLGSASLIPYEADQNLRPFREALLLVLRALSGCYKRDFPGQRNGFVQAEGAA